MPVDNSTLNDRIDWFVGYSLSNKITKNACLAMLCNAMGESGCNYAIFQGGNTWYTYPDFPSNNPNVGVGWFQLTTADPNLLARADDWFPNGNEHNQALKQLQFMIGEFGQGQWIAGNLNGYPVTDPSAVNLSWQEFLSSNLSVQALADAWLVNYERPAVYENRFEKYYQSVIDGGFDWRGGNGTGGDKPPLSKGDNDKGVDQKNPSPCLEPSKSPMENDKDKKGNNNSNNTAPSSGGGQAGLGNGRIPLLDRHLGETVGWGCTYGQCFGLAMYWANACGGPQNVPQAFAKNIWLDGTWDAYPFSRGAGVPPGGWKTGDICCLGANFEAGHVIVVANVDGAGNIMSWYAQNDACCSPHVPCPNCCYSPASNYGYSIYSFAQAAAWNGYYVTGYVRPQNFPK